MKTDLISLQQRVLERKFPIKALKHHFTSLKTDLISLQQMVLERKFTWNWFTNIWKFSLIFKPQQIIFIHYKSRIATAIRGL